MNTYLWFKKVVESVMNSEGRAPLVSLASVFYMISLFYGAGQKIRQLGYRRKILPARGLPCKVVCVGNIAVGGTGKTPMTMYVAEKMKQFGYQPAIVSRGYRGEAQNRGGVVSDGRSICMGPEQAGDEPYLLAGRLKDVPVIVGKDRYAAGMLALKKFQPDVIVLDDGFQHLRLHRDVDLVLLDHRQPFGNMHLLPRGILREPISGLERATACILTRYRADTAGSAASSIASIRQHYPQLPVFTSSYTPYWYTIRSGAQISIDENAERLSPEAVQRWIGTKIFGFSGIARNQDFQNTVKDLGFKTAGFFEFSDHHCYTPHDLNQILAAAEKADVNCLITTEKDLVRLPPDNPFHLDLIVVGVRISFGDGEQNFITFLKNQLSQIKITNSKL
ncbi:MAG: tetraacyldisaccharide 4'-kinase [Desulfobacterales bacterium]|nr:MAG: tetraacyldisaccharide 4'-kinase [Desulfobacterales bacterium]